MAGPWAELAAQPSALVAELALAADAGGAALGGGGAALAGGGAALGGGGAGFAAGGGGALGGGPLLSFFFLSSSLCCAWASWMKPARSAAKVPRVAETEAVTISEVPRRKRWRTVILAP